MIWSPAPSTSWRWTPATAASMPASRWHRQHSGWRGP
jgi:hypothetical protein